MGSFRRMHSLVCFIIFATLGQSIFAVDDFASMHFDSTPLEAYKEEFGKELLRLKNVAGRDDCNCERFRIVRSLPGRSILQVRDYSSVALI